MDSHPRYKISKFCLIPQRILLAIMGCLAVVCSYTMRNSLSMAITEMVPVVNTTYIPSACDYGNGSIDQRLQIVKDKTKIYNWTETDQGNILGAFYYGYIITHIPGGMLAEEFGGKHVLGTGLLLTAIFTLLTPTVIYLSNGSVITLVILRVIVGFGEGPTYPALNAILAQWIPARERGFLGSLVYTGAQFGSIISNFGSGVLISTAKDWSIVFYVFGSVGILWWIAWILFCFSSPVYSPYIKEREAAYLHGELKGHVTHKKRSIPLKAIFTSVPVWALVAGEWGHDWGWYMIVTDLPKYMKDVLKFNIKENAVWSSIPYIAMWLVGVGNGYLCDWLVRHEKMTVTFWRKLFTGIGAMGPAFCMMAAVYSGCHKILAVSFFTIAMGLMGTYYSSVKVNAMDLAPNFAGTVMAVINGIGCLAGILTPVVIGVITTGHTFLEWQIVFWIAFAFFTFTTLIFCLFGTAEEQPWNKVEEEVSDDD